jgi:hypothetical protein
LRQQLGSGRLPGLISEARAPGENGGRPRFHKLAMRAEEENEKPAKSLT